MRRPPTAPPGSGATYLRGYPLMRRLHRRIHLRRMRLGRRPARRDSPPTRRRRPCRWVPAVTCHEHGTGWHTGGPRGALTLDRGHAEIRPRPGKRDDPRSWPVGTTRRSSGARLSTCIGRRRVRRCEGSRRIWVSLGTRCRCGCMRWTQSWPRARQALVRALVPARGQARFRGFVLAIAARCRRFMRCTPGPIGLF